MKKLWMGCGIKTVIRDRRGITLAEVIVASAVFLVLIAALLLFSLFATKTMAASTTKSDSQAKARQIFTYVSKAVHPAYTVNILSAKPGSFSGGRQYFYLEDGYLKHYDGIHTIKINNEQLQNLTVTFSRGISAKVVIVTISFTGLTSPYSEQVLAQNAGSSAGSGTSGLCLETDLTP